MPINTDKILKELEKGTPDELYAAFFYIKGAVQRMIEIEQKQVEERANELQNKIDEIVGEKKSLP